MSEKKSKASKAYWSRISPEERSRRMTELALLKNKSMTKKERKDHALKMVKARSN